MRTLRAIAALVFVWVLPPAETTGQSGQTGVPPSSTDPLEIARAFLRSEGTARGLTEADLSDVVVVSRWTRSTGGTCGSMP
jgi:hypothetical protein